MSTLYSLIKKMPDMFLPTVEALANGLAVLGQRQHLGLPIQRGAPATCQRKERVLIKCQGTRPLSIQGYGLSTYEVSTVIPYDAPYDGQ